MATGDILQASINSDGWSATIRVEGVSTGGTYDFGFGAKNDPTNATILFFLTSPGYDNTGVLGTIQRTVYGTFDINEGARRLAYPNQTTPDETVVGSDVDIVIPLSDYVVTGDSSITVDIGSGWYTQGGNPSNAASSLAVTNNSIESSYPKPIGNWAYPGYSKVTGNFAVEFSAFHRFDVACVKISATDGSNTVNYTVTDLTISPYSDYTSVLIYRQVIDVTTLNDGVITVDAVVYPKVGNASSLLDTGDAVNTWPTPLYTSQKYRLDTGSNHGFAVVDPTSGDDGTGTVYNSQAAAEAGSAYQTTTAALTALQSYHNTNASHSDAGSGTVLCTEDTHAINTTAGGTYTEFVVLKPVSTASRANVIFAVNSLSSVPTLLKFENVTIQGSSFYNGADTNNIWFDQVDYQASGVVSAYKTISSFATHCIGSFPNAFLGFSTTVTAFGIVRGNSFTTRHQCVAYTVLGNRNVACQEKASANICPVQNNVVYGFNYVDHNNDSLQVVMASAENISGLAIVQNALIRYGTQTQPMMSISGDLTTTTTENVIMWHNSIVGARCNIGYNDIATGGPYTQKFWSVINNIFSNYNNKDDTFNSNSSAIGSWPVGYFVGGTGNFLRTSASDEWFGEFQGVGANKGTSATPLEPLYVDDQSADGGNTLGGDYHLQATSPARALVYRDVLPYDLDGRARIASGSTGAFEFLDNIDFDLTAGAINTAGSNIEITILSDIDLDLTGGSISVDGDNLTINLNRELSMPSGDISIIGQSVDISISSPSNIDFDIVSGEVIVTGDSLQILVVDAVPYIQELLIDSDIQITLSLSSNIQSTIQLEGKI